MSSRRIILYVVVVLQVLLLPLELLAAGQDDVQQPITKRYDEAILYYNQLQTQPTLSSSRANWLTATRNFRRVYLSGSKSYSAPSCLFMLGRVYSDMHDHFQIIADLEEAISYFEDTTRLFPRHRLADDAYFALGQIHLEKRNNPGKAADFLQKIVSDYPGGDMFPEAEQLLKTLSKENDIPLPKMALSPAGPGKLSKVLPIKYWSSKDYARVVIMASSPVIYSDVLIEKSQNKSRRLYINFQKSYIEPQYRAPVPIKNGLLRTIRSEQYNADTVQVVLNTTSLDDYKIFCLPDPYRVVIDVHGKDNRLNQLPATAISGGKNQTSEIHKNDKNAPVAISSDIQEIIFSANSLENKTSVEDVISIKPPSLAQQLGLGVKKIIIDPGHGGKDPGAMAFGMKEKDIVLGIARKLVSVLESEMQCEVILTRDKDVFIPLEERTAIANTENGDIFVSLHINAHPSAKVRGIETYHLNLSTNAEAMRVAARENAISTHQMSDLQDILSDIMKNSKISESARLAEQVHNSIYTAAKNNGFSDIKNHGVKQAPFYVLIGAEMPAILLEIAFISNEQDAGNLQDPNYLNMLTQEIAFGIRNYATNTTAQLSFNGR